MEIFEGKEFKYYSKLNTKLIGTKENVHNSFHWILNSSMFSLNYFCPEFML